MKRILSSYFNFDNELNELEELYYEEREFVKLAQEYESRDQTFNDEEIKIIEKNQKSIRNNLFKGLAMSILRGGGVGGVAGGILGSAYFPPSEVTNIIENDLVLMPVAGFVIGSGLNFTYFILNRIYMKAKYMSSYQDDDDYY